MTTATAWGAIIVSPQLRMLVRRLTDEMIACTFDDGSIYLDYRKCNKKFSVPNFQIENSAVRGM